MVCIRDVVEYHIDASEKSHDFAEWAFGPAFRVYENKEFVDAWNEQHSELMIVDMAGKFEPDVIKMINLWREHRHDIT